MLAALVRLDLRQELGELAALAWPLHRLGRPRPREQGVEGAPTLHGLSVPPGRGLVNER
jgi:hypothetical protein